MVGKMIIVFDATGQRVTDHGTNSAFPEGVPYEPKVGELVYRLHDETDKVKVDAIMQAAMVEAVITGEVVTDVTIYKRISATVDKPEILANGIDTATITCTVDDPLSTETIELYNGATLVDSKPCVTGSATFLVTMTQTGTITLTVKSTTKYGQRDATIEGV
jgi:hypothetical protein